MADIPRSNFSDWIWPVPMFLDNPPVISDGYGRDKRVGKDGKARGHFGVDIMHPRRKNNPLDVGVTGSKNFVTYPGEEALLAGDGLIKEIGVTSTGHFVRAEHRVAGRSILSVYRHLMNVRPEILKGEVVKAGFPLGLLGDDPTNQADPIHLHFELWDLARTRLYPEATIDPELVMAQWRVKRIPQGDIIPHPNPPKGDGGVGGGSGLAAALLSAFAGLGFAILVSRKGGRYIALALES